MLEGTEHGSTTVRAVLVQTGGHTTSCFCQQGHMTHSHTSLYSHRQRMRQVTRNSYHQQAASAVSRDVDFQRAAICIRINKHLLWLHDVSDDISHLPRRTRRGMEAQHAEGD